MEEYLTWNMFDDAKPQLLSEWPFQKCSFNLFTGQKTFLDWDCLSSIESSKIDEPLFLNNFHDEIFFSAEKDKLNESVWDFELLERRSKLSPPVGLFSSAKSSGQPSEIQHWKCNGGQSSCGFQPDEKISSEIIFNRAAKNFSRPQFKVGPSCGEFEIGKPRNLAQTGRNQFGVGSRLQDKQIIDAFTPTRNRPVKSALNQTGAFDKVTTVHPVFDHRLCSKEGTQKFQQIKKPLHNRQIDQPVPYYKIQAPGPKAERQKNSPKYLNPPPPSKRLHVSNIPFAFQRQDLLNIFGDHGAISADVIRNDRGPKGFGFVTFNTEKEASQAKRIYDGIELNGRVLEINYASKIFHQRIADKQGKNTSRNEAHKNVSAPIYRSSENRRCRTAHELGDFI